jgi:leucyl/phenylalanyl-tRNA--protein transferase
MKTLLDLPRLGSQSNAPFPPAGNALAVPNGLLAWGGDLQPERLLSAYRQGTFPWYTEGQPILWWSPAPRCVIRPADVYLSTRTRRRYNSGRYRITADQAFEDVIRACAEPRDYDSGTWITRDMLQAYIQMHQLGHAHSVEVWEGSRLAGGIYGLAIGRAFFGESMFSQQADASKIALLALCRQLEDWSFGLLDCQVSNPHLLRMGAVEIPRAEFLAWLTELVANSGMPGSWSDQFHCDLRW